METRQAARSLAIVVPFTRFSPREGILLMETYGGLNLNGAATCFSPREGILLMETAPY